MSEIEQLVKMSGVEGHSKICIEGVLNYLNEIATQRGLPKVTTGELGVKKLEQIIAVFQKNLQNEFSSSEIIELLAFFKTTAGHQLGQIFYEGLINKAFVEAYRETVQKLVT